MIGLATLAPRLVCAGAVVTAAMAVHIADWLVFNGGEILMLAAEILIFLAESLLDAAHG